MSSRPTWCWRLGHYRRCSGSRPGRGSAMARAFATPSLATSAAPLLLRRFVSPAPRTGSRAFRRSLALRRAWVRPIIWICQVPKAEQPVFGIVREVPFMSALRIRTYHELTTNRVFGKLRVEAVRALPALVAELLLVVLLLAVPAIWIIVRWPEGFELFDPWQYKLTAMTASSIARIPARGWQPSWRGDRPVVTVRTFPTSGIPCKLGTSGPHDHLFQV